MRSGTFPRGIASRHMATTYDVLYSEAGRRHPGVLAAGLERETAVSLARAEARRRGVGRMFAAGSEQADERRMVLIVESGPASSAPRAA